MVLVLISVLLLYVFIMEEMFFFYCGELSGIFIVLNFVFIIVLMCVRVLLGVILCKIVMRGRLVCYCMSDVFYFSLKCYIVIYG